MFVESDREGGENLQQVEQNKENERKKAENERKKAEEMTLKRKAADNGQVTLKKRGSGTETLVYLREKAEKQFELRKEELEVKKKEQSRQMQMFQAMQQQQQQQMQVHIKRGRLSISRIENQ